MIQLFLHIILNLYFLVHGTSSDLKLTDCQLTQDR